MKVVIVCGSPSSEMLAPFDDTEWEIWVLGNRIQNFKGKRVTRIFEIHDNLTQHQEGYAQRLADIGIPMVVGEKFPIKAEHIEAFNYDRSEALYGSLYLTSSPAYMMSHAISIGATEIGIYGVDLAIDNHEYFWQRPCMEAWVGFAKGKGIKITMPSVCPVGKSEYVEGRDWNGVKNEYRKGKAPFRQCDFEELSSLHVKSMDKITAQIVELQADLNAHSGAQQTYERLAKVARAVDAGTHFESLAHTTKVIGA